MTSGTGILTVGLHQYVLGAGDIAFLHPDELISRQKTSVHTGGHFCLIHPRYFEHDADHVLQLLRNPPYFKASKAVIQLTKNQSAVVNSLFESMVKEDKGNSTDKKQAILLYLQILHFRPIFKNNRWTEKFFSGFARKTGKS